MYKYIVFSFVNMRLIIAVVNIMVNMCSKYKGKYKGNNIMVKI